MKASICPAVLAATPEIYNQQIERVAHTALRLHIDLSDGKFAPTETLNIDEVWWPGGMRADLHVMYKRPFEHVELMIDLKPQLIIVHAEADGDFMSFAQKVHAHGIEVGVALQAKTPVDVLKPAMAQIDHVLIFSGSLGSFGGHADLSLLEKVKQLRVLKSSLEIGWDGGIDDQNAKAIADAGVDVLNSGGFVQKAADPRQAYAQLVRAIS
ncbi:MAG: ribulose-phosphate 3-epimerase [Candidatus Saccharibacteria bacterium]